MTISFVGAQGAAAATVTIPTHQIGDLILIFAYRDGNNPAPGTPAAGGTVPTWNLIGSSGGNSNSSNFRWARATATTTTSGTWTNASELICLVYREASIGASIGGSGNATTTLNYRALTLQRTDDTSWVVAVAGHRTATDVDVAPGAMVNRASAGTEAAGHDTNATVTTWGSTNVTVNASSAYRSWVVELQDTELELIGNTETFTLSGTNTELNINLQLNLTTVGFTLAGTNTGLLFNSRLDGSTATFAFAGTNTGLLFNRQLDQTAASFVLSGINADLLYDRSLLTTVGTFTLAGTSTDLLANRQLDLTTEGFTLVGVTTELQRLLLLNQLTGSFVLTGNNADLDYFPIGGGGFTLDCLLGTYTVSGTLLELNKAKIFTLVSKDFSVFFLPAELRREFTLNTNAGSFNINTFNLAYFASRTLNAQRAAFSVYVQDGGSNIFRYVPLSQPVVFTPIPKGRNQWILGKFTSGGKGSFRV